MILFTINSIKAGRTATGTLSKHGIKQWYTISLNLGILHTCMYHLSSLITRMYRFSLSTRSSFCIRTARINMNA